MAIVERPRSVSIGCVNFATAWGDKPANLAKILDFTRQAAAKGCDILLFPELALSGYECSDEFTTGCCAMHRELAETIPGPATEAVAEVARENGIYVVFGLSEKDVGGSKDTYNSAAVVGPEGLLGSYRKIHLMRPPFTESTCFSPGDALPVFQTKFGLIGVQICFDFWTFPMLARVLMLKGARIILNAAASPAGPGKEEFTVHQTLARGVENMVYTATANLTGKDRTKTFYGHGTIAGRGWKISQVYAESGPEEGIVSATLNLELLESLRKGTPLADIDRTDIVIRELEQLRRNGGPVK